VKAWIASLRHLTDAELESRCENLTLCAHNYTRRGKLIVTLALHLFGSKEAAHPPRQFSRSRSAKSKRDEKRKRKANDIVDFFKDKLFSNVFQNNIMTMTTIKNASDIQLELDATITGHESDFFIVNSVKTIKLAAATFASILNELNPELMLTESHFDIGGELHQFLIQFIISMKVVQCIDSTHHTLWKRLRLLTAVRQSKVESDVLTVHKECSLDQSSIDQLNTLQQFLRTCAGETITGKSLGYIPESGSIEHEILESIGVLFDLATYKRAFEVSHTIRAKETVVKKHKGTSNANKRRAMYQAMKK
jgi:hypothetical protein